MLTIYYKLPWLPTYLLPSWKDAMEMSDEQFLAVKARLRRILRRCGWTIHLRRKKSGWYASAAKRDVTGSWHGKYIAPLHRVSDMDTGQIVAILPPVA